MTKKDLMKFLDEVPDTAIICVVNLNSRVNDVGDGLILSPPVTREYEVLLHQTNGRK